MPHISRHWLRAVVRAVRLPLGLLLCALPALALTLTAPNGGEIWNSGSSQAIAWTAPGITGRVHIDVNRSYPADAWETICDTTASLGTYLWAVTNPGALAARVRVISELFPDQGDTSDADFTIGGVAVLAPNGGEDWIVGSTNAITWAAVGFTGNVSVQINRNYPAGSWITLFSNTPNDGNQSWNVTTPVTSVARIRVRSTTTPTIGDSSDANFAISLPAILTLTAPNGGEAWQIGSPQSITWTSANVSGPVRLDLDRVYPSGVWETIADSAANTGAYSWLLTGPEATGARVRIRAVSNLTVGDTSAAGFSILTFVPPAITLTAPNGAENWILGSTHTITWNSVNVPETVRIQLNRSYPAGVWETLADNLANSGIFSWTPAEPASLACRVRIVSTTNPAVGDTSGGNFYLNVPPALALLAPNGGETLVVGSGAEIRWTSAGLIGDLTLDINRTYPVGAWQTLSTTLPNNGSYIWTVTTPVSGTARFRLRSTTNPTVGDTSNADVTIVNPRPLIVLSPNGGEVLGIGTASVLRWMSSGITGDVMVDLNRNYPGDSWETIWASTANDSAETWTVTGPETAAARLRIRSVETPATGDTSNANFSIVATLPPVLHLLSPNGIENWAAGTTHTVSWTSVNVPGRVRLDLKRVYPTGSWERVADSVENTGSYAWTVTAPTTLTARLRISSISLPVVGDSSDGNFFINIAPGIMLGTPNGGEVWTVGETRAITWTSSGLVGDVTLEIDRAYPSGSWTVMATTLNDNEYAWTVNAPLTACARLRVRSVNDPAVADTCDADFTIADPPRLTLSAPVGGENWIIGSTQIVRFTRYRVPGGVAIELNRAFPLGTWEALIDSTLNDSTFAWQVGGAATTTARMRVRSLSQPALADTSFSNFTIGGLQSITVVAPNGGESWLTGSSQSVTWTSSGVTGNVSLELNRDYPAGVWTTLSAATPNTGSFTWPVTGPATTTARVRVRSVLTPSVGDSSDGDFTLAIPVGITLTSPAGGENWVIGSTHAITWSRSSAPGNITLELSRSYPTGSWETIVENSTADTAYDWLVNGPTTSTARIRIRTLTEPSYTDTSAANFMVSVPQTITVTAPNGGESWTVGTAHNITWLSTGVTSNVTIQIKPNYPTGSWTNIIPSTPNTGSYLWTVGGTATTNARIRIRSTSNPAVSDTSDSPFTLLASVMTLTFPNGGETLVIDSVATLRWVTAGVSGAVSLDVNRDFPAGAWEVLADSVANIGSWPWTVTGPAATNARLRLRSHEHPEYADTSDAECVIAPTAPVALVLNDPLGGDVWTVATADTIAWSAWGITGLVRVELNRNYPTGVWETLTATAATAGPFVWTVTNPATTAARIRILAVSDTARGDTSNFDFSIRPPQAMTVTVPNGGEAWWQGAVRTINWTSVGLTGNVAIELCRNYPGAAWTTITGNTGNSGAFDWTVTGPLSATARIRVRSLEDIAVGDTSDADFAIVPPPQVVLHSPNGGENWYLGRRYAINWATVGITELLAVELDRAYPSGEWEMLGEAASTDTSLNWVATGPVTTTARIRVRTTGLVPLADTSGGNFSLQVPPMLTVLAPNGGEVLGYQQPTTIHWTRTDATGLVRVQWDPAYPAVWQNIGTSTGDSLVWLPQTESTAARLRVLLASDSLVADTCDASFAVTSLAVDPQCSGIPREFTLAAIYPNPFNPTTRIILGVPRLSVIRVRIYDILGREVTRLYDGPANPGYLRLSWNARTQASGTYIVSFEAPGYRQRQTIRYLR